MNKFLKDKFMFNQNGITNMIQFTKGNILKADVEALVNTVNTVGVMGKGIALDFKNQFPDNYRIYRKAYEKGELKIGKVLLTNTGLFSPKYILNFPTKKHWRGYSKLEYISEGLKDLVNLIHEYNIKSIAIPPLGCGNGGLEWEKVKPLMLNALTPLQGVEIIIYEPGFNNQNKPIIKENKISLTPSRAMLILSLNSYQVLGYSINLLVAQKLAYFLQRLGEKLNLKFEKGYYGPYSHQLQHMMKYLNGYFVEFEHEQTSPGTIVKLKNLKHVEDYAEKNLSNSQKERLANLKNLIEGFESPYGLELLATIDYIEQNKNISSLTEVESVIGQWTNRKRNLMKPYHIKVAHLRVNDFLY
ncbi:MAG: macro domain-containing protein, partial [Fermentimonas sp.]|nr:macro domain-containing protein [Fermentimonas sp.]